MAGDSITETVVTAGEVAAKNVDSKADVKNADGIKDKGNGGSALSAAARARMERNRLRARQLHEARLLERPGVAAPVKPSPAPDSGGGFIPESEPEPAPLAAAPPAPLPHVSQQPTCLECGQRFPHSYLFDTFDYSVCDACRDPEGAHSLVTRTEAKSEYLLKDCDIDKRPPPLRALVRRNPHAGRGAGSDMRLYVRAAVEARAREVWGGEEALIEEREKRAQKRIKAQALAESRRLRALRMDVRSTLYRRERPAHVHCWGDETYDKDSDEYSHTCLECGHTETYEKM